ncbi:hypothetical protein C0993_011433 [Termitomyces sp. T159_Od127]|nr:hypothetical protein C0993_011433 [Termitomyces sp. T159_Od127]
MPSRSTDDNARRINIERQSFKQKLAAAVNEEDDPLSVYVEFVQWTIKNCGEDPNSGLKELLVQATRAFMNDPIYKTDLRYLKLWTLYAGQVDRANAIDIYANLLASEIGTSFALLYEGYATLLEVEGRRKDAEVIYRQGIRRQARPLERLKKRYQEFRGQNPTAGSDRPLCPLPKRNHVQASSSPATLTRVDASNLMNISGTAESRYAVMLAPPDPGKRPEKYCFNMALLFTKEGGEFCIQEARARSMGLLGKKWPPPPPESFYFPADTSSDSISMPVDFNDDGSKTAFGRRRSILGGAEPTVTINTRAALDDVFGMYNSPDKTMMPGSKYGPLRQVRPSSVGLTPRTPAINEDEVVAEKGKTPTPAFRPFIDENSHSNRTPSTRVPSATPRPALSIKDPSAENQPPNLSSEATNSRSAFATKVFTPAQPKVAPLRDVFTEAHGKSEPKPRSAHEHSDSHDDLQSPGSNDPVRTFTPFTDESAQTPFKVFSRPPVQPENVFTPKVPNVAFQPFIDPKPAFTPFRDVAPTFTPHLDKPSEPVEQFSRPRPVKAQNIEGVACVDEDRDSSRYDENDDEYDGEQGQFEVPLEPADDDFEGDSYQEMPLGRRFGRFNVMTPITERTFEFTTSTRGSTTPSDRLPPVEDSSIRRLGNVFTLQQRDEYEAVLAAEKLAAELKEDEANEPLEPLRLSAYLPPRDSPSIEIVEERTGALSLGDSLTLGSQFKPSNPCNPFDLPIVTNLLSRIPSDPHFYDLRDQESNRLDGLQKFARKSRKTSGSGNTGGLDVATCFSLKLEGHEFSVMEKLGEGGFGAVFKARDVGAGGRDEDLDDLDDDGDEENMSLVAVKVVKPRNLWEYHVLRRLHSVLPATLRQSIILPHALYVFRDESFLILDLCPQGTLLDIVNNAVAAGVSQQGACLDELLVVFFTVELLRLLEAMHKIGFIHGDLKIDNCLLRLEDVPGGAAAWSSSYSPTGEGGWSHKGLRVIDFGRTIDTRLFPAGQQFIADWPTDDRDCFEARQDRPWTFQTDYYGLVGIIYCMLFGKYIHAGAVDSTGARHRVGTPLKRYWQTDLWNRLFDVLLNPTAVRPDGQLPVSDELGSLRQEMESWLQANCNRASGTLKGLLKKVEVSCYKSLG